MSWSYSQNFPKIGVEWQLAEATPNKAIAVRTLRHKAITATSMGQVLDTFLKQPEQQCSNRVKDIVTIATNNWPLPIVPQGEEFGNLTTLGPTPKGGLTTPAILWPLARIVIVQGVTKESGISEVEVEDVKVSSRMEQGALIKSQKATTNTVGFIRNLVNY